MKDYCNIKQLIQSAANGRL